MSLNIHELTLNDLFEIVGFGKKEALKELIQLIKKTPFDILEKIDFNQYSDTYHTSLLSYTLEHVSPLFDTILEYIPAQYLDFTKVSSVGLFNLMQYECEFLIEKLKDTNFNLNAICDPVQKRTVFSEMVEEASYKPNKMLKILQNFPLEQVDLNTLTNKSNSETPLVLIIKCAVEMNSPKIVDTLLEKIPFRNLDFTAQIYHTRYISSNIVRWLNNKAHAHFAYKILEAGIKQSRELYHNCQKYIDEAGDVEEKGIKSFEEHIQKLEDFVHLAKTEQFDYKLAQLFEELGLQESLKKLAKKLPLFHSYRAEIFGMLGHLTAYSFEVSENSSDEDNDAYKQNLLKALKYALDGKSSLLTKQIGLKYIYAIKKGAEYFPSQTKDSLLKCVENLKSTISKDDKKLLLSAFYLKREIEELKEKKCLNSNEINERNLQVEEKSSSLIDLKKKIAALTLV